MIVMISSASSMVGTSKIVPPDKTIPFFQKEANKVVKNMMPYSSSELAHILNINPKMANENYYRFQNFFYDEFPALQAILAYVGVVFKNINPDDFTSDDFYFAQKFLRISSFLYGLLKPLDLIKPYRMEPYVELAELYDGNMYNYWRDKFTNALLADILQSGDNILINLASTGNFGLFKAKESAKKIRIITPEFKIIKNGKMSTPVIYIKMARGQMLRFIIKNKITDTEILKTFDWGGFIYNKELSDNNKWVFLNN